MIKSRVKQDLIAGLDVVVSVDTSVAHLAGAMGKPTLLLHPGTPDWRWEMAGRDSPWYPAVQVFRRDASGWGAAMADVARALAAFEPEAKRAFWEKKFLEGRLQPRQMLFDRGDFITPEFAVVAGGLGQHLFGRL